MLEKETLKEIIKSIPNKEKNPEIQGIEIEHDQDREERYRGFEYLFINIYKTYFGGEKIGEVEIVKETTWDEWSVNSFVEIEIGGKTYSPYEFLE